MKATGIVRRIDDLGRVVIPKEIRRTMRIREGDPLEIYTNNDGEVVFKKYSPINEISSFSSQYADAIHKSGGLPVIVCDKDHVVSVAGMPKKEVLERRISPMLEDIMFKRQSLNYRDITSERFKPIEGIDRYAVASAPIIASGDVHGCIILLSNDKDNNTVTHTQEKLVEVGADLLGKQLE